jgi:hypothetical protein
MQAKGSTSIFLKFMTEGFFSWNLSVSGGKWNLFKVREIRGAAIDPLHADECDKAQALHSWHTSGEHGTCQHFGGRELGPG